ncbi:hypothetical protein [Halobacillus salinus]|uniref:Uncharacterized protein n=1 Tax=Halobacillus salinus TaxID=192814 RepID=A0A4Z0GYP2_9BACI|nr:hypothetical protein [Halobacillus salinus]TGB02666.1 hypothetical protein E4663_10915 [Halobacillus salinus]
MEFRTLFLDDISIAVNGYYSVRIDRSLVFQLKRQLTSSLIGELRNRSIQVVEVHSSFEREKVERFLGPFRFTEQFGVLVLDKL